MKTISEVYCIAESCLGRVDFDGEFVTPNPRGKWTTTKAGRIYKF